MTEEQFPKFLQALIDKPITNIQPPIFNGAEGEDILQNG